MLGQGALIGCPSSEEATMEDAVIVSALRTPVGSFGGQFKDVAATELGACAVRAALERAEISPARRWTRSCSAASCTAGLGQNPARQVAIGAGVPKEVPATTINMVCGSGLKVGRDRLADDPGRRRGHRRGGRHGEHDARSVSDAGRRALARAWATPS